VLRPRRLRRSLDGAAAGSKRGRFKYKKEEGGNRLILLDRDGQFLSELGQHLVVNGQKLLVILVEPWKGVGSQ
jgi:hypothetical protein